MGRAPPFVSIPEPLLTIYHALAQFSCPAKHFFRVAYPPRMWLSALFASSMALTSRDRPSLMAGNRSRMSLRIVVLNKNALGKAYFR